MTNTGEQHPDACSIATLLRLAADGELTPEQRARLDAHLAAHPEDAERIAFEQELKKACAKACCPCGCAPAGLRERVRACCCTPQEALQDHAAERPFRLRRFVSRFGALAALIALIAVVGFMAARSGLYGRETPGRDSGRLLATSLASFVRTEHARCTEGDPDAVTKFSIRRPDEVPQELEHLFGHPVALPCLVRAQTSGLEFVDAGVCHPPGGDALHLRFRRTGVADESRYVSLWVQEDNDQLAIEDGVTYTLGQGCECVRFWRDDGVRYVLVCPDQGDAPEAALALACPAPSRSY